MSPSTKEAPEDPKPPRSAQASVVSALAETGAEVSPASEEMVKAVCWAVGLSSYQLRLYLYLLIFSPGTFQYLFFH